MPATQNVKNGWFDASELVLFCDLKKERHAAIYGLTNTQTGVKSTFEVCQNQISSRERCSGSEAFCRPLAMLIGNSIN